MSADKNFGRRISRASRVSAAGSVLRGVPCFSWNRSATSSAVLWITA